ncbi:MULTISPECIES: phycobiliprotein lyase [Aphanothece]|uniref:phycobiliprotein lyase n=1 Tax=Aphanothece TaxID=1121 RepID=UPI003984DF4B
MTETPATATATPTAAPPPFPPQEIGDFLRFCAGEWMSLRSQFALDAAAAGEQGDEWHSSERGELVVAFLEPLEASRDPGGLSVGPKGGVPRQLQFSADGRFSAAHGGEGHWELWPDGSLELRIRKGSGEVRERIWFTKPNLRLRSTVEHPGDGLPARASFSSEIRRVSRPATGA